MTSRVTFYRKIVYLVVMALLLLLIIAVGAPASRSRDPQKRSPGGLLAQLQERYQMSEAQLGELDPTSAAIKLATLGMRGVAVNVLWWKSHVYKMKKDWTNLSATLQQIVKLEQHFVTVWRHQGWNLSYNVSAEFDDYRERFRWVIRGIEFLKQGIRYNEREPILVWDVGWFTAQKIGRADEHKQFRRLFLDPTDPYDIHGGNPPRDNWLVGKDWFAKAEALVDSGVSLKGTSPVVFFSDRPKAQMNYAEAIESEGTFGERARMAWKTGYTEWVDQYGRRGIPTSYGEIIQLNDKEKLDREVQRLVAELDALEPGLRQQMIEQRRAELTDAEREALDTPPVNRTAAQYELASAAEEKIKVTHEQVARRVKGDNRKRALELAKQAARNEYLSDIIARYRQIVNFEFWRRKCEVEQTAEALAAREFIYKGDRAFAENDPIAARDNYRLGCAAWGKVLAAYPDLAADELTIDDLMEMIDRYMRILDEAEEMFPPDFGLAGMVRSQVEQKSPINAAREELAKAEQAQEKSDLVAARKAYQNAMAEWRKVLDKYPSLLLRSDPVTCDEIMRSVDRFAAFLGQVGEQFGDDFPLRDFVRQHVRHAEELAEVRRLEARAGLALADAKVRSDLQQVRFLYDQILAQWRKLLDRYPSLVRGSDRQTAAEISATISQYRAILKNLDEPLPEPFVLQDFLDAQAKHGSQQQGSQQGNPGSEPGNQGSQPGTQGS